MNGNRYMREHVKKKKKCKCFKKITFPSHDLSLKGLIYPRSSLALASLLSSSPPAPSELATSAVSVLASR